MTDAPDIGRFGQYLVSLPLDLAKVTPVIIEIFANSPKDGAEIDKVSRNATIDPNLRALEIYFGNAESDPKGECEKAVPAIRSIAKGGKNRHGRLAGIIKRPDGRRKSAWIFNEHSVRCKVSKLSRLKARKAGRILPQNWIKVSPDHAASWQFARKLKKLIAIFNQFKTVRISVEGRTGRYSPTVNFMPKTGKTIVVLGGGIGGVVAVHELSKRLMREHKIILIEKEKRIYISRPYCGRLWDCKKFQTPKCLMIRSQKED